MVDMKYLIDRETSYKEYKACKKLIKETDFVHIKDLTSVNQVVDQSMVAGCEIASDEWWINYLEKELEKLEADRTAKDIGDYAYSYMFNWYNKDLDKHKKRRTYYKSRFEKLNKLGNEMISELEL